MAIVVTALQASFLHRHDVLVFRSRLGSLSLVKFRKKASTFFLAVDVASLSHLVSNQFVSPPYPLRSLFCFPQKHITRRLGTVTKVLQYLVCKEYWHTTTSRTRGGEYKGKIVQYTVYVYISERIKEHSRKTIGNNDFTSTAVTYATYYL